MSECMILFLEPITKEDFLGWRMNMVWVRLFTIYTSNNHMGFTIYILLCVYEISKYLWHGQRLIINWASRTSIPTENKENKTIKIIMAKFRDMIIFQNTGILRGHIIEFSCKKLDLFRRRFPNRVIKPIEFICYSLIVFSKAFNIHEPGLLLAHTMIEHQGKMCTMYECTSAHMKFEDE